MVVQVTNFLLSQKTLAVFTHEENSEKILSLRDILSQLKFIVKMKNSENNEEVGNMQQ